MVYKLCELAVLQGNGYSKVCYNEIGFQKELRLRFIQVNSLKHKIIYFRHLTAWLAILKFIENLF